MAETKGRIVIFVIDSILKSGARGRNRTTDTRIFNRSENRLFNKYNDLFDHKIGVHKNVFFILCLVWIKHYVYNQSEEKKI